MFSLNILYFLLTAGIGFLLGYLLWQFYKKQMRQKKIVFGQEKIYVNNDVLLEMFQFCDFRTVGIKFCLVNRRWSQFGQWHCQNRPHRIPKLILDIKEEEGRHWFSEKWEKKGFLRSLHQNATENKLTDVLLAKIPKNYEKIQNLCIAWPYDWEDRRVDWTLTNFISACSAHMGACQIHIRWNGAKPDSSYCQLFGGLFLSSISQLHEIHFLFEGANQKYYPSYNLYSCFIDWLLGISIRRGFDDKTPPRKLYLMNINSCDVSWYLKTIKEKLHQLLECLNWAKHRPFKH